MMELVDQFKIPASNINLLPKLSYKDLNGIDKLLQDNNNDANMQLDDIQRKQLILCLLLLIVDNESHVLKIVDKLLHPQEGLVVNREDIIKWLVDRLQPLLLKNSANTNASDLQKVKYKFDNGIKKNILLNTKLRLNMFQDDDDEKLKWKQNGGLNSIPLMYGILKLLHRNEISSNLWWINPAILNLLDDTTDLQGIVLKGVLLLNIFLQKFETFDKDDKWITFKDTGLFQLYEPLLKKMCYFIPPMNKEQESIQVMTLVFPVLNQLYYVEFERDLKERNKRISEVVSEILLQNIIPRLDLKYNKLLITLFDILIENIKILKTQSVIHLQRIIYVLGQYFVKNPFITLYEDVIIKILELVSNLIEECPSERLVFHKYDLLGLEIMILLKCRQEGLIVKEEVNDIIISLKKIMKQLESKGCNFEVDEKEMLISKHEDVRILFLYTDR
ncbi:Tti2p NDAI_0J02950 [Naumovozyma dairenensis CBS 421]|uniref:Uncharacterized protein n=1 Tax=Naumovozyma dairenensis (strain ATCC 10597 / BCRC 20456 / CBS 421 / NBRC 0211 / NRRL Y-12639) TaxID=1071378 RepID=G0WHA9_NAUDC|nr:hypothetical protein NDAI_0J02950 [Naumovozyma dairenensis CBS 421]CCD27187.1 hypothetical protein NDAI_0J02950 [Naumovozyma dairenensis CBS 421]